jgi:hypothetical protein
MRLRAAASLSQCLRVGATEQLPQAAPLRVRSRAVRAASQRPNAVAPSNQPVAKSLSKARNRHATGVNVQPTNMVANKTMTATIVVCMI